MHAPRPHSWGCIHGSRFYAPICGRDAVMLTWKDGARWGSSCTETSRSRGLSCLALDQIFPGLFCSCVCCAGDSRTFVMRRESGAFAFLVCVTLRRPWCYVDAGTSYAKPGTCRMCYFLSLYHPVHHVSERAALSVVSVCAVCVCVRVCVWLSTALTSSLSAHSPSQLQSRHNPPLQTPWNHKCLMPHHFNTVFWLTCLIKHHKSGVLDARMAFVHKTLFGGKEGRRQFQVCYVVILLA